MWERVGRRRTFALFHYGQGVGGSQGGLFHPCAHYKPPSDLGPALPCPAHKGLLGGPLLFPDMLRNSEYELLSHPT